MPKEPVKKEEKKTRSRAACLNCKLVKQRCCGTNEEQIKCRRCELYGLECRFPSSSGPLYTVPQKPRSSLTPASPVNAVAGPSSERIIQEVVIPESLTDKLFDIAARLASIEGALQIDRANSFTPDSPLVVRSASPSASSVMDIHEHHQAGAGMIEEVSVAIERVAGVSARFNEESGTDYGAPDAIRRGILRPEECQELFEFFFASLHPWIMILSLETDRNAMDIRTRSPLLFHAILLLATSYSTPFPSNLHTTLGTYLNNIIAPIILSPQPNEINSDFLRAIDILNIHKPVQLAARRAEGLPDDEGMKRSKVNGLASWMLQGILARTSERLALPLVCTNFLRASASGGVVPTQIIADVRLYYVLLIHDIHGSIQSGAKCGMPSCGDILKTTRLFASLRNQPYDVRLAATTELFEIARPILRNSEFERTKRLNRVELEKYSAGVISWELYWSPILTAALGEDQLAISFTTTFKRLAALTFNACAFNSWKKSSIYTEASSESPKLDGIPDVKPDLRRMKSTGARPLTEWEFTCLSVAVRAAESLIFCVSEESRMRGGFRSVQWEEAARVDGYRKLTCDEFVVEQHRWSMDAISCVAYIFPIIFLVKLFNEGLLTAGLVLLADPVTQPAFISIQKLPRLLELGAIHLDAISTNAQHPSKSHANVIRSILEAGLRGRAVPQLPRHASVVLSPAPSTYPIAPDPLLDMWSPSPNSHSIPATLSSLQQQRYQLQMHQTQMAEQQQHHDTGRTHSNGSGLEAVLEGVDLSLFGDNAALWNWGGSGHDGGHNGRSYH